MTAVAESNIRSLLCPCTSFCSARLSVSLPGIYLQQTWVRWGRAVTWRSAALHCHGCRGGDRWVREIRRVGVVARFRGAELSCAAFPSWANILQPSNGATLQPQLTPEREKVNVFMDGSSLALTRKRNKTYLYIETGCSFQMWIVNVFTAWETLIAWCQYY